MKNNKTKFFKSYINNHQTTFKNINLNQLNKITQFLEYQIRKERNIFIAGNGGSASIANHLLCDFNKGIKIANHKKLKPRVISLSNSIELITAISNDISYDEIFSFQINNYYKKNDCLICFSCSGQSKNIINVINFAKKNRMKTILFQGFGKINHRIKPDFYLNLNNNNYGICEDIFSSIMHIISQSIYY
jgi:phosphoheptose isomerase